MHYYLGVDGRQEGPLPEAEIAQRIASGRLKPSDLCWTDGWAQWRPLREVFPGSFAAQAIVPPPIPGKPAAPATTPAPASMPTSFRGETAAASGTPAGPPQTNGLAVTSMVLGLAGLLAGCLTGLPAVICGHIALGQIKRSAGALGGRGMAVTGLVLGYLWIALGLLILPAAILIPTFVKASETAKHTVSQSNLRQVVQAGLLYALDHEQQLPSTYEQLREGGLGSSLEELMDLPYTDEKETDGYVLVRGLSMASPSDTIYAYERIAREDGSVAVGYLGGNVQVLQPGDPAFKLLTELQYQPER